MFLQATESPTSVCKNELFALLKTLENFCPNAVGVPVYLGLIQERRFFPSILCKVFDQRFALRIVICVTFFASSDPERLVRYPQAESNREQK